MTAMKHARFIAATVLAALLRCIGGFCGGRGGVTGGQSVQYAAAVFSGYGLFKKDFELFLGQRYAVGDKAFKKPHAAAKAFDVMNGGAYFYVETDNGFPLENIRALLEAIGAYRKEA